MVFHRFVEIKRGNRRRVKTGQPHGAYKDQLQLVRRVFKTVFNIVAILVYGIHFIAVQLNPSSWFLP